jgi:hypothetical protein
MIYLYAGNIDQVKYYARTRDIGKEWINLSNPDTQLSGARNGLIILCGTPYTRKNYGSDMEIMRIYEKTRGFKIAYDNYW